MRIGMIMDTPFPPDTRVENEAETLLANGHEVYLFHIDYENRPSKETYNGVKITRFKAGKWLYKLSALVYTIPIFQWVVTGAIRDFIRAAKIDVLHIHDMVIADAVFRVNKSFSLPIVLDLHENRPEIMKLYKHTNNWPGNRLICLERWKKKQKIFMLQADHIILVTEEARQDAATTDEITTKKITALPNTVNLDRFDIEAKDLKIGKITEDRFTLLYIGDTSIRRGTMIALEAVEKLQEKIPKLQLIMVGSSSQDDLLQDFVQKKKLSGIVRFEGWQNPGQLPAYINAADLCLSPLLRNQHHDTTLANKLFQYMACGKAVVGSSCPAQKKILETENCGVVYANDDPAELARVIMELYNNPEKVTLLGRNGAKAVQQRWNWNVTAEKLVKVYEDISRNLKIIR